MKKQQKPAILQVKKVASSALFTIESVDLEFSNGEKRVYERMKPGKRNAVMIVPVIDNELILIREYAVGIENYELGFPKGIVEQNEDILIAANREMMEEIGFGARRLTILSQLTTAPSYFSNTMTIVVAEDLYPQSAVGDEPEPLIQVRWPISEMMSLLGEPDFREARNVSALFLAREYLNGVLRPR